MDDLRFKGNAAFKAGDYGEAAACYTEALNQLSSQPTHAALLLCNRSAAYYKQGLPQRALDDAEHSVALDGLNAKAHYRMALALRKLPDRLPDAVMACRRALELQPNEQSISSELESLLAEQPQPQASGEGEQQPSMSSNWIDHRPSWLDDGGLQEALLRAKLVRVASPFPAEATVELRDELVSRLPEEVWGLHRGASEGFQYSHHNLYCDHAELQAQAPAYARACTWLQSELRDWFERASGHRGHVTVSASWYKPGDYSTPHNDLGRGRHIAFVWHLALCGRASGHPSDDGTWDQRLGGDFVWCEPYHRFPPSPNALYLFRVHDASHHFVQQVVAQPPADLSDEGFTRARRLALNGWFVLDEEQEEPPQGDGEMQAVAADNSEIHRLEARLSNEGCALYRELQARVLCGREAFVHHHRATMHVS